ncbi:MAG: PAS domain-containing protein [Candidatus Aminicenantes bacterium]|jgi:PAS domain S-box-containing protein
MSKDKAKTKSQLMDEREMLRQKVAALELAVESAGLGVWDHDLVSDRVTRNERWAEMLGYTLEELESDANAWRNLVHPDDMPRVNQIAAEHEAGRTPFFQVEHRLRCKNGEWKWILNWGKIVKRDKDGRPLRATGTHLDITERKQEEEKRLKLEAQIQQAQKFESLNVMAGSIAHNFNNLLMVVLGNLELALDSLPPLAPERKEIENAEKAAQHAAELSSLMITYVGHKQMAMQELEISVIIRGMSEMLELVLSRKTVLKFNCELTPALFRGDPAQIRQVVMNLVSNAAEAVGDNQGTISLTTGTMFCDRSCFPPPFQKENLPEGDYVYLEVADTGCGMDQETQEKIFDPFFTTKFQGRGLGMAVVLGILRTHRGTILLDSQPGEGTTIRVLFPALEAIEKAEKKAPGDKYKWKGKGTVLMIDDDADVLLVGERMLKRLGFQVLTTPDAAEGIEIFQKLADIIDCVLTNLTMPKMDGVELFHKLREIRKNIPVIICSDYTKEQVMTRFREIRPEGFIQKPYRIKQLEEKMKMII